MLCRELYTSTLPPFSKDQPPPGSLAGDADAPRHWHLGHQALDLGEIFRPEITLAVMQRRIDAALKLAVQAQLYGSYPLNIRWRGPISEICHMLERYLPAPEAGEAIIGDISLLGAAMGELFEVDDVGLRL